MGQRMCCEGIAARPADALLLMPEDLEGWDPDRIRWLCVERHQEKERNLRLSPPEHLGSKAEGSAQRPAAKVATHPSGNEDDGVFQGTGYTPAQARGRARKTDDMTDAAFLDSLSNEDILVCGVGAFEGITDWLSILMSVRGIVSVERPTRLHHVVQLARECGVALVHLKANRLADLSEGAEIELDGLAGTVRVLSD
jgi:hypothetical protein